MGKTVRPWRTMILLAAFAATAVSGAFAGEPQVVDCRSGKPEWNPGDLLRLSLRVARAMKDEVGIARYKSLERQRRLREQRPFGGKTAPPFPRSTPTGRYVPWGR